MSIELETNDLQLLIGLLQHNELMQDDDSRRVLLRNAGLKRVLPLMKVTGSPFVASSNIVSFLSQYGRISYENEALGLFLNGLKPSVGVTEQDAIDQLLLKYRMMDPIAPPGKIEDWKSTSDGPELVEKIFGESTLRPIAFLDRGVQVSRSVAYISVTDGVRRWCGTGFMIAPNLAMTNHHVVSAAALLPGVELRFNYQEDFSGRPQSIKSYRAVPGGAFHASQALDYAILEVGGEPGGEWGFLPVQPRDVRKGDRVNIIQHPNGQPKQISMQNNLVEYVGGNVLQYVTSTNPGSSGSPVFNDGWQVIGLHHAGGLLPEPTTGKRFNRNEGILIQRILADLPAEIRLRVDRAAAQMEVLDGNKIGSV
ncbi:trypsin-like peptidase domain-containing protein [Sorangium sp. So ce1182]|uniref:trypsin-like peptidase domain-containing protein n=1 Tax=Sorangium sp. So ce1182 TaxID=3133334 RepID=UPI003F5FB2C2